MTNYSGNVVSCAAMRGHVGILAINSLSLLTTDLVDVMDDKIFHQVLTSKVKISSVKTSLNGHIRLRNIAPIDPQTLATRWMISPNHAKCTVVMTTQHGVRTCLNLPVASQPMTGCYSKNDSRTPCSLTICLHGPFPIRVTKCHRFTPIPLDGPVHTR